MINKLDGFSTQPRITVPFTGAIDPASVNSDTVYLVNLGDTLSLRGFGDRVGINQVRVGPGDQHAGAAARRTAAAAFALPAGRDRRRARRHRRSASRTAPTTRRTTATHEYDRDLRDAHALRAGSRDRVVAASLFTTQSITADLQKITARSGTRRRRRSTSCIGTRRRRGARRVPAGRPAPASSSTARPAPPPAFATVARCRRRRSDVVPGAVAQVAYGTLPLARLPDRRQVHPGHRHADGRSRSRRAATTSWCSCSCPAGPKPAGGWPVAIFGHGFTDSMYGAPWTVASVFASRGHRHGVDQRGRPRRRRAGHADVLPKAGGAGRRCRPAAAASTRTATAPSTPPKARAPPAPRTIIGSRDGLRQTVVDLMQLVRRSRPASTSTATAASTSTPQRIYYAGQSFGGIYGTMLLGVEPQHQAPACPTCRAARSPRSRG